MSELVYRSLENLGEVFLKLEQDQTDDFTPMIEDEQEQELVYGNRSSRELVTGESINQLVVSPKSETDESRPEGLTPLELGSEVHRALEKIVTSSDWDEVKKSLESGYRIGEEDRATIISRVSEVLNSDETKGYFAHGLKVESEQSFVNSEGQILRPDRIVKSEEGWTVIDYKSSTEGESKHKKEVEEYCSMLSEIEGDHVEGVIIYTDPLKVLKSRANSHHIRWSKINLMFKANHLLSLLFSLSVFTGVSAQEYQMRKGIMVPINNDVVQEQLRSSACSPCNSA